MLSIGFSDLLALGDENLDSEGRSPYRDGLLAFDAISYPSIFRSCDWTSRTLVSGLPPML